MIDFIWKFFKKILFLMDAERAHSLVVAGLKVLGRLGPIPLRILSGNSSQKRSHEVFGLTFTSRLGLAAGFDKNAELLPLMPSLGFGFSEIGTVTPRPQPGNPKPRLFRDAERQLLFNRMGFNNHGAVLVAQRVAEAKRKLPPDFRIGVNVGKNFDTPLEKAPQDYATAAAHFVGLADYLVINVSSPNTQGLRSLQEADSLSLIVKTVKEETQRWKQPVPILVKLMPELEVPRMKELSEKLEPLGVNGWILTNTLAGERAGTTGGWSGKILTQKSRDRLTEMRAISKLPIISVGGIDSPEEALKRLQLGAQLVQIYSGWVFGGPQFPAQVARGIEGGT